MRHLLLRHYERVLGRKPTEGGFKPNEEVVAGIVEMAKQLFGGDVKKFLELSLTAFILRNGGGVNRPSHAPFFVNTAVLADSNLDWLEEHGDRLALVHRSLTSSETFEGLLKGEVLAGEVHWLEGAISLNPPDFESLRPPVFWMLASILMRRFERADIPDCWFEGSAPSISDLGRVHQKFKVFEFERQRVRSSKLVRELLVQAATAAIQDASYGWVQQHKLALLARSDEDEAGWCLAGAPGDWCEQMEAAIWPTVPLAARDSVLRRLAVQRAKELGLPVRERSQCYDGELAGLPAVIKPDLMASQIRMLARNEDE